LAAPGNWDYRFRPRAEAPLHDQPFFTFTV
jgi:hypothetical protein